MGDKQTNSEDRNDLPHTYPHAKLGKMVSEKKGEEKKKQKQRRATIVRGPGKAGVNHHLAHSVFPWPEQKEGQ